jgi:YgiT-type zinc finger domain-containing protein
MKIIQPKEGREIDMSFWEGETCEYCSGDIVEKRVTLHRQIKDKHVLLEDVPAGVCRQCGTRYYAANVLKTIEEHIRGRLKADREIIVSVYSMSKRKKAGIAAKNKIPATIAER